MPSQAAVQSKELHPERLRRCLTCRSAVGLPADVQSSAGRRQRDSVQRPRLASGGARRVPMLRRLRRPSVRQLRGWVLAERRAVPAHVEQLPGGGRAGRPQRAAPPLLRARSCPSRCCQGASSPLIVLLKTCHPSRSVIRHDPSSVTTDPNLFELVSREGT